MFKLFRKKEKKEKQPQFVDIDNQPLMKGDIVEVLRYNLGRCKLIAEEGTFYYESLETGEKVVWLKMIDASTDKQKVRKVVE